MQWYIYIWTIVLISRFLGTLTFIQRIQHIRSPMEVLMGKSSNWGIVHRHDYQRVATIESFMKSWNCLFFIKLIKTYRFLIKFIYLKIEHPTPSLVHDHVAIKIAGTPFRHNPCKCYCFDVYIITVYTYKTNHIYRGIPSRFNLTPCSW